MPKLKNRTCVYIVMRHDFSGRDVVIAATLTFERADELKGEYQQMYTDKGISEDECYFYVAGTNYYQ